MLTKTAKVHAAAWKDMFDAFLRTWAERHGETFVPFDSGRDYDTYVDGKARADGVRSFVHARGIELPEGRLDDPPGTETIHGLAHRKNDLVLVLLRTGGVEPYEGSVRFVHAVRAAGLGSAVVSSSENCRPVLEAAEIDDLFDVRVDARVAAELHLAGKPAPDMFIAAAHMLGVEPAVAAVFEDSLAGVEAGRMGRFGVVVGVNRTDQAGELHAHGADLVVDDLDELLEPA